MASIQNIALVIVGFGFLIFVHEFGHFIFAKLHGVKVIKFSLGFGPAVIHFNLGETEYAVSAIPLGGYCKLAGEVAGEMDEDSKNVPRDRLLNSKTVGQRAQIFVAGAMMNLLVAFPLGVLMIAVGGLEPLSAVSVGGGEAFIAGVKDGDVVTEVAGEPVEYWFEMEREIEKQPVKEPFNLTVRRNGEIIPVTVSKSEMKDALGLAPRITTKLGFVHPTKPARKAGLKIGDEIISVLKKDEKVVIEDWNDFEQLVSESIGEKLIISVRREKQKHEGGPEYDVVPIEVTPEKETLYTIGAELDLPPAVAAVQNDSPAAKAGILAGDAIASINGNDVAYWSDITRGIKQAGTVIDIVVERDGEQVPLNVERSDPSQMIGIAAKEEPLIVAKVSDIHGTGSELLMLAGMVEELLHKAGVLPRTYIIPFISKHHDRVSDGLQPGDLLLKVQGKEIDQGALGSLKRPMLAGPSPHEFEVKRGGAVRKVSLRPQVLEVGRIGVGPMPESRFYRPPLLKAVPMGLSRTANFIKMAFGVLGGLFAGKVPTSELAGPVGVITLTYQGAQSGWQNFLQILMLISVSLGIFNLLPVPILDGGHLAFLLIEKLKGKPVNDRAMIAAQYVGLVLLLTLVLCVTWNDIRNFF